MTINNDNFRQLNTIHFVKYTMSVANSFGNLTRIKILASHKNWVYLLLYILLLLINNPKYIGYILNLIPKQHWSYKIIFYFKILFIFRKLAIINLHKMPFKKIEMIPEQTINLTPMRNINPDYKGDIFTGNSSVIFPAINATEIDNCYLGSAWKGWGIYSENENKCIVPSVFNIQESNLPDEIGGLLHFNDKKRDYGFVNFHHIKNNAVKIPIAINMCQIINNFGHFFLEQAPKLALIEKFNYYPNAPILINADLTIPTIWEVINIINKNHRPIIKLPSNVFAHVEKLINIDEVQINPFNALDKIDYLQSDFAFHRQTLDVLLDQLYENTGVKREYTNQRKIFIKRNAKHRVCPQQDDLITILTKQNFDIISIENLNFIEQMELLKSCKFLLNFFGASALPATPLINPQNDSVVISANTRCVLLNNMFFYITNQHYEEYSDIVEKPAILTATDLKNLSEICAQY